MRWWVAKAWILSWWCEATKHRWAQKRNERLCLRCGRRETRIRGGSWHEA